MVIPGSENWPQLLLKTRPVPQETHRTGNFRTVTSFPNNFSSWSLGQCAAKADAPAILQQTSSEFSVLASSTVSHSQVTPACSGQKGSHWNFPVWFSRKTYFSILQVRGPWTNVQQFIRKYSPFSQKLGAKFWSNWNLMQLLTLVRTNRCYVSYHRLCQWNSPNLGLHYDNFV